MAGKKYTTCACLNCRRRKVKCDGKETCSNCSMSKLTCEYDIQDDLRKVSAKRVIAELRARVTALECVAKKDNNQQPATSGDDLERLLYMYDSRTSATEGEPSQKTIQGLNASVSAQTGELSGQVNSTPAVYTTSAARSSTSPKESSPQHFSRPAADGLSGNHPKELSPVYGFGQPTFANNVADLDYAAQAYLPLPTFGEHGTNTPTRTFQYDVSWPVENPQEQQQQQNQQQLPEDGPTADDNDDEVTKLLATRMGSLRIAEDGQLRYYGPTSNLHVQSNGCQSLSQSTIRQVATEGFGVLQRLGIGQEVPSDLENHLARLYFAWEDPAIHVVDEESFFKEKRRYRFDGQATSYYSETLNNAICAIGATMAVGENLDLPEPAHELFSARAKALLDIEMDSPTVATVQALVIMSATEAAFTRDARGWLYSGMAARLSAELGLHLDVTQHIGTGIFSKTEVEIRRTTFWGVFIHENMWSLYTGRPWGLDLRHITVPRPNPQLDEIERKTWRPYPNIANTRRSTTPEREIAFPIESCTDATITLCELMRSINTTLYSGQVMENEVLMAFLVKTRQGLYNWLKALPVSLAIDLQRPDAVYSPAVLQLHMQFYGTLVSLYRPYLSSSLNTFNEFQDSAYQHDGSTTRNVTIECIGVAHQVAELLRCYKKQHTLNRVNVMLVHIVFSACLILTYDVTRSQTAQEPRISLRQLQFCCHSLGEIGQSFGNARRALEVITLVKSEWEGLLARRARSANRKRQSMSISAESQYGYNSSKRCQYSSSIENGSLHSQSPRTPPSFDAFRTLCDDHMGNQPNLNLSILNMAGISGAGPFSAGDFSLGDLIPSMGWLEDS